MRDDLGNRQKSQYEDRTRYMLPRRTYTIVRCDGKAFHTFTRGFKKPFDALIETAMDAAALELVKEAQGSIFAYIQSDEISALLTDFARPETDAWFDGNLQKICSVSASIATMAFNRIMHEANGGTMGVHDSNPVNALFDARVFVIPDPVEVENYFVWRQKDAERNSLSMLAQQHYSPKELQGKSCADMHEMLHQKDVNWNDLGSYRKRGRMVIAHQEGIVREIPVFTKDKSFLTKLVPRQWVDENAPDQMKDLQYFLNKKMTAKTPDKCCGTDCTKDAEWVRKTQFAGDLAFCEDCSKKFDDFGTADASWSYAYWVKLGT